MVDVKVYDGLISEDMHSSMYDWAQNVSWYCKWIGMTHLLDKKKKLLRTGEDRRVSIQEYIPELSGKSSSKHILGAETSIEDMIALFRFSMYRHPIGWSNESTQNHCREAWNIFTSINNQIFDGKATLDAGLKEAIAGLSGPTGYFISGKSYYDKYNVERTDAAGGFTCYLNGRSTDPMKNDKIGQRNGQMHKDTDPRAKDDDPYYTVLFVLNKEWHPDWGGEITFFNDEDTGAKHWKRGYNLGWPEMVVGNKPGRIIVYKHNTTHISAPPRITAPEITQRLAFRIKVI
tara:strand:- start:2871 stop:3737 length:867 start_codon:yes stop_codon:yes gene_type:complete